MAQLVRNQQHIRAPEPSKFNQAVDQVEPERSLVLGLTNREPFPGWTDPDPVPVTGRGRGKDRNLVLKEWGRQKILIFFLLKTTSRSCGACWCADIYGGNLSFKYPFDHASHLLRGVAGVPHRRGLSLVYSVFMDFSYPRMDYTYSSLSE
jgi:hypothetical protein